MSIGSDVLLATQNFTGSDGSAYPAGWTERQGNWQIAGNALGIVTGEGIPAHSIYIDPARANDNYKMSWKFVSDISNGTLKGVMLRRTNGSSGTNTCYLFGCDDTGHAVIWKLINDDDTVLIDGGYKGAWLNGTLTASAETVGNDVVLTMSSSVDGSIVTYTDLEANSPLLSGDLGCQTTTNGSQMAFDDITIIGTASGTTPGNASGNGASVSTSAPAATVDVINVKITGYRLITKSGAPAASLSGITALVSKSVPSTTSFDKRITGVSTNGSGILADLDISDVQSNGSDVWLTLMLAGSPNKGTTVRVTPTVT